MHGTAVPWEPQEMSGLFVQSFSEVLLCRHEIAFVLLHWCQNAQITLYSVVIVVSDVVLNHGNKFFSAHEASAVVSFPFQNTPEAFHRAVINAFVLNGGLDIQAAADPQYPFLVHIQSVVMGQIVLDTAVAFVRTFRMDLLHNLSDLLIFQLSGTLFAADPTVVGGSGHAKQFAG